MYEDDVKLFEIVMNSGRYILGRNFLFKLVNRYESPFYSILF